MFFTVCAVAGTILERRVGAQSSQDESQLRDSLKTFTDVYALVEQNYAEPITGDKADGAIYDGAIPGMLQVLDPHSHFYDPKSYARLREDQRGHYYGVGMVIQQQNDEARPRSSSSRPMRTRPPSAPAFIPATRSSQSTANPPTAGPPTR